MRVPGSRMWAVLPTTVLWRRACADVFAVLFELGYKGKHEIWGEGAPPAWRAFGEWLEGELFI